MKVLVPYEGSVYSRRAAEYAIRLAKSSSFRIEIVLLTVVGAGTELYGDEGYIPEDVRSKLQAQYSAILEKGKKMFDKEGIPYEALLAEGDPGSLIIQAVDKYGIDHIVMGSRGSGIFKGLIIGSVAYKVLGTVNIPVTIIK